MNLEEVGSALKAERERRGLRIEDVANKLKISPRLLTALEMGNNAALPHPAYVRGFIRSYASMLGISPDDVRQWLDNLGAPQTERKKTPEKSAPPPPSAPKAPEQHVEAPAAAPAAPETGVDSLPPLGKIPVRKNKKSQESDAPRRSIFLPLLLFILCVATGVGIWAWQTGKLDLPQMEKRSEGGIDQQLPQADVYMAAKDSARDGAADSVAPKPPASAPAQTDQQQKSGSASNGDLALPPTQLPPTPVAEPEAKPAQDVAEAEKKTAQETPPAPRNESHKVIITAVEECWVHSNADKTDTRQFSLRKGDTFALTFNKSLELKLGNAGGVRLRYDGEDLPAPGTSGQVRTITFPPDAAPRR